MIHTEMTDAWGLRYPIVGAPMVAVADGRLAAAVASAGGLGMIGIGNQSPEFIREQSEVARSGGAFGIGLSVWTLEKRPDLLEASIAQHPDLLALSFGETAPYVPLAHAAGIRVAAQVSSRQQALAAERAGVDVIVAQGGEAGGHTGDVATLPLLQIVLETVKVPVLAAGGIGSAAGVAAALAAGAAGVWLGTAFLSCPEALHNQAARSRLLEANETETMRTHVFDVLTHVDWPDEYAGRALTNPFLLQWQGNPQFQTSNQAVEQFRSGRGDYQVDYIYAGQGVGLTTSEQSAADIVRELGEGAEIKLRNRMRQLLGEPVSS